MPASGAEPAGVPPPSAPGGLTSATVHGTELLSLRHAAKAFGAVQAIADGSIELYAGEAHALVGENGAGKSTMVKILAGVHQLDSGMLMMDGKPAYCTARPPPGTPVSPSSTRSRPCSPT